VARLVAIKPGAFQLKRAPKLRRLALSNNAAPPSLS